MLDGKGLGGSDCIFMRIDADDRTSGDTGDPQSRTSCSTSDIEQDFLWTKVKPLQEPVLLVRGQPAVLTNVLAKCFTADIRVQLRLKMSIIRMVVISRRR
jgi:hypothetical protein